MNYEYFIADSSITPVENGEAKAYNKTFHYYLSGMLISETNSKTLYGIGSETTQIVFLYDESSMIGFEYTYGDTTTVYYYLRNLQGDVIGIYDTNGSLVVKYNYDAWGNCTIASETTDQVLAHANPIRYRGYYYDVDTGLYYCNARYYNPEWRRFISPDDTSYLDPESVNGLNLYAYCYNDPVNYADPSGHIAISTLILCGLALVGMGLTIGGVASDNNMITAIGLTMVAVPALISGVGALFSGAIYLSIIGGVTAGAGRLLERLLLLNIRKHLLKITGLLIQQE